MSPLEYTEKLEQLRVLWNGGRIQLLKLKELHAHGVDTWADMSKVRELMSKQKPPFGGFLVSFFNHFIR